MAANLPTTISPGDIVRLLAMKADRRHAMYPKEMSRREFLRDKVAAEKNNEA
jgi:hypothetical protein